MRKSSADRLVVTSVRIPQSMLDRLKIVAKAQERTVAQEVRWLIAERVADDHDTKAAA